MHTLNKECTLADKLHLSLPQHINFAITYNCNGYCRHCSISAGDLKSNRKIYEMSREDIFTTLKQIADIKPHLLALCGGEAILHPNIFEIIEFCRANDIFVALATNGLAIDEIIVKKLLDHGLNSILISLDHTNAEVHNLIRGVNGVYESAIDSIKLCVKNKLFTTIGITPMKQNYDNVFEIVELAISLGANAVNLSSYVPTGRGTTEYDLTPEQWGGLIVQWVKATDKYKNKIRLQCHDPRIHILKKDATNELSRLTGCLAGYTHCYILPDGSVNPCVMLPITIGNVKDKHLKDIILQYQEGENFYDRNKLKGKCGICSYKHKCGGCRAVAYAYTGDVYESDPHCWLRHKQ